MSLLVDLSLYGQLVAVEDVKRADISVTCRVVFTGIVGSIENTVTPKMFELVLCVAAF